MKNDYSFKLVAAIVLAGVVIALVSPAPKAQPVDSASPLEATHATSHAE